MERQGPRLLRALRGNMQRAGYSNVAELAREADLSIVVIEDIFSGKNPNPRDSHLSRIAFAFAMRLVSDRTKIIVQRNNLRDSFKRLRDQDRENFMRS